MNSENSRAYLNDWLGYGAAPDGWHSLAESQLLILIGLTGVGKTTTVNGMRDVGIDFRLLPNRRTLTDALIIGTLQREDGEDATIVRDRSLRFAYTRRYRERYAGGMAHVLAQLQTNVAVPLLFDGLRGVNEVSAAVALFPAAKFLVLTAPNGVRLRRLIERRDAFDSAVGSGRQTIDDELLAEMGAVIEAESITELVQAVEQGTIEVGDLAAKLRIVSAESANYDPDATLNTLLQLAPERTLVGDTLRFSAEQIASQAKQFFP